MKPPYALLLLVAVTTAYGQINNPISSFTDLTVRSLNTSEPVTWALDAVQTNSSGASSFSLTLPDNGNVIRVTNAAAIRNISNGRLGAFYYVVNQSGSSFAIENTNGITVQGGRSLTLAANEVATLVATGPTNVSVAGRGDLTDVALGGTANTAPSQTASSGSSLMTRSLSDARYLTLTAGLQYDQAQFSLAGQGTTNGGIISASRGNIRFSSATNNGSGGALIFNGNKAIHTTQGQNTASEGYGIYAFGPTLLSGTDTVLGAFYGSMLPNGMSSFEPLSTNGYSVQVRNNGTNQLRYVYKDGTNEVSGPWTFLPASSSSFIEVAAVNTTNGFRVLYRRPTGQALPDWVVLTNVVVAWSTPDRVGGGYNGVMFARTNTANTNILIYDLCSFGTLIGAQGL